MIRVANYLRATIVHRSCIQLSGQMVSAIRTDQTRSSWKVVPVPAAIGLAVALVAAAAIGVAVALHVGPWAEAPLPVCWPVPSFTLTDQLGCPFSSSDLSGRAA